MKKAKRISVRKKRFFPKHQIIINQMYSGSYLHEGENIGHEVINLYLPDGSGGYVYLWLNPPGTIPINVWHEGTNHVMLLTRYHHAHVWEILAKAETLSLLPGATSCQDLKEGKRMQKEALPHVEYGGKNVFDIFGHNTFSGKKDDTIFATFRAEKVTLADKKHPLYISDDPKNATQNTAVLTNLHLPKQGLRMYENDSSKNPDYQALEKLIKNNFWGRPLKSTATKPSGLSGKKENYLALLGDQNLELPFSNLLRHFLGQPSYQKAFVQEVLGLQSSGFPNDIYEIKREERNVDLLFQGSSHTIVIENKIDSGLNGRGATLDTQCKTIFKGNCPQAIKNDYQRFCKPFSKKSKVPLTFGITQLSKYYLSTEHEAKKNKIVGTAYFILVPNYQETFLKADLASAFLGDKYSVVLYSKLRDFFNQHVDPALQQTNPEEYYLLKNFIKALDYHSQPVNNEDQIEMARRFNNAIYLAPVSSKPAYPNSATAQVANKGVSHGTKSGSRRHH